ncbi:MAG: glucosyl-3-phosphoglycerate synthase [Candidatus Aerophobetes bacterium]|nr:glucosyl-3-phosphoglycerate synthase [Candidatus Aerophobetes bacterium]
MGLQNWFKKNTFHSEEFSNMRNLVKLKEKQGLLISMGIPTLNEEDTIGKMVRIIRRTCMEEYPLLDELVVLDSNSQDGTRDAASKAGARVCLINTLLPEEGRHQGKGESLWKSLYLLKGDIIIWLDGDIKNMHPHFVYGLLGPLLKYKRIGYVKGFYRRPLKVDGTLYSAGGGRVTEILVRPLLNLFFPELSEVIQPLAGEYTGRREILEQVPFFNGYGVEIGLLIDIYKRFGLKVIAQVNLEQRIHHNQRLPALSKMSFAILQAFLSRAEKLGKLKLLDELNDTLKMVRYHKGEHYLVDKKIKEMERPPIITLDAYREKKG